MTTQPILYATKTFPEGEQRETYDALSLNRRLLEQEDLLGLAYLIASNFLSEPHGAAEAQKVQEALRDDGKELVRLSSFIGTIPDANVREVLTKRYDRLQKQVTDMDLRLGQDRLTAPQGETKNSLPKLLFTVGFPAGFATALRTLPLRDWVVGCATGVVWGLAVWAAYGKDFEEKWTSVTNELCSKCERKPCIMKQNPAQKGLRNVMAVTKCYVRFKRVRGVSQNSL